jgi:AcrR family transcriptional regulator
MRSQPARPYHHGDLRPALLRAAVEVIGHAGPAAMSLREVARRAGVTHAAAAYHFGDKAGLLTAVAAQGYRILAEELRSARDARRGFLEVGVAYMRFAVSHRAHFEVMYQPELYRRDDAEVGEARAAAAVLLYGTASPDAGQLAAGAAAWSLVHGLATLWLNGNLPPQLGDDPEEITRQVASYLSIPANPGAPPQRLPTEQADPRAAANMRLVAGDRTDSAISHLIAGQGISRCVIGDCPLRARNGLG